ncbi:M23 family metallopeptidase [Hyphomicrobium facile]|uniref:Peptidase family M23 n=1 Tax=Hyphomicrobium facile TaxID=51670 RepID=A0A1I7NSV2_9HYPH|nr:M23 family metallopeptidase [Hyphomicrobium facile]SFV37743.1 Peptidase family M23 [Hyphomicrobium facile]
MQLRRCRSASAALGLLLTGLLSQGAASEDRPELSLPLACQPHKTCFIQNYVDIDPGRSAKDYMCGRATYEKHSGVDFRLLSAAATTPPVAVLASADGTVKAVRDGVADVFFKKAKPQDVAGRECGNGVILDHGGGWETQYCHMRQGSVRVAKDQAVKRGDQLGDAGFSGMADFAQVHISVRHDGKIIDPFLPDAAEGKCDPNARGPGMWQPAAAAAFPYKNGEMIGAAFAGAPPTVEALEINDRDVVPLTASSPAIILYGRFINLMKGDLVRFVASGPGSEIFDENAAPLERDKATYVAFAGKRRLGDAWPAGHYSGRVELIRDRGVIATNLVSFDLPGAPGPAATGSEKSGSEKSGASGQEAR